MFFLLKRNILCYEDSVKFHFPRKVFLGLFITHFYDSLVSFFFL